jgi:hypothetical protein
MGPQDLESELKKEPFQPFRIVTTSGKTYDIPRATFASRGLRVTIW